MAKAPGPHFYELAKLLPSLFRNPIVFLNELASEFGPIVRMQVTLKITAHFLLHPDHIQHVLQDNHRNYLKNSPYHDGIGKPVLGKGILSSQGEFWLRQRRMIQPIFHHDRIEKFVDMMLDSTSTLLGRWEKDFHSDCLIDMSKEMSDLGRNINSRLIFGADLNDLILQAQRALLNVLHLSLIVGPRFPTPFHRRYYRAVGNLDDAVWNFIEQYNESRKGDNTMLAMLFDTVDSEGRRMSLQQIRDEVMTLVIAGYETTEKALAWVWYLLARNPLVEKRLHEELDEKLNGNPPNFEMLQNLEYTRSLVLETLRLYPPAWVIGRRAREEDEIGGYQIPAGSAVILSPYLTHRFSDFWQQPEQFVPERFSAGASARRSKYAYLPFGGGPRQCVGSELAISEMIIIVAMIAQKYRLELAPDARVEIDPVLTLQPKDGLPMSITPRD